MKQLPIELKPEEIKRVVDFFSILIAIDKKNNLKSIKIKKDISNAQ